MPETMERAIKRFVEHWNAVVETISPDKTCPTDDDYRTAAGLWYMIAHGHLDPFQAIHVKIVRDRVEGTVDAILGDYEFIAHMRALANKHPWLRHRPEKYIDPDFWYWSRLPPIWQQAARVHQAQDYERN